MTHFIPVLPPRLQYVVDEVWQHTQAPHELIISSLLGAMSLAVQHRCRAQQKPGLEGPASLYLLTICESGERKTAVQKLLFRPFQDVQSGNDGARESRIKKFETDHAVWIERYKALQKKLRSAISKGENISDIESDLSKLINCKAKSLKNQKRLIYTDTTPEALMQGLHENGKSAALVHDEFGLFAQGHMGRQLPFLNTLWSGDDFFVDRKKTDCFVLKGASLTCFLQAQPGVWFKFLDEKGEEARNNGFLSRALICYPNSTQGTRFENTISQPATSNLTWFYDRCRRSLEKENAQVFRFSPETQLRYIEIKNWFENQINTGYIYHAARDFASKAPEHLARICAVDAGVSWLKIRMRSHRRFLIVALGLVNYYGNQFLKHITEIRNHLQIDVDLLELSSWIRFELERRKILHLSYSHITAIWP